MNTAALLKGDLSGDTRLKETDSLYTDTGVQTVGHVP